MRKEQGTKDKNWRKHLLQCQRYKLENGKRRRSEGGRQIEAYTLVTGISRKGLILVTSLC